MSENDTLNETPEETPATDVAPKAHADQAPEQQQPPTDNEHVAEGCEKFDADPVKTALDKADAFIKQVEGSPYAVAHEARALITELAGLLLKKA